MQWQNAPHRRMLSFAATYMSPALYGTAIPLGHSWTPPLVASLGLLILALETPARLPSCFSPLRAGGLREPALPTLSTDLQEPDQGFGS